MRIDEFIDSPIRVIDTRYEVTLLRGRLRGITGLIGKTEPRSVMYRTRTAPSVSTPQKLSAFAAQNPVKSAQAQARRPRLKLATH
jgi:hypothetical protein